MNRTAEEHGNRAGRPVPFRPRRSCVLRDLWRSNFLLPARTGRRAEHLRAVYARWPAPPRRSRDQLEDATTTSPSRRGGRLRHRWPVRRLCHAARSGGCGLAGYSDVDEGIRARAAWWHTPAVLTTPPDPLLHADAGLDCLVSFLPSLTALWTSSRTPRSLRYSPPLSLPSRCGPLSVDGGCQPCSSLACSASTTFSRRSGTCVPTAATAATYSVSRKSFVPGSLLGSVDLSTGHHTVGQYSLHQWDFPRQRLRTHFMAGLPMSRRGAR